jgi:predicted NAD-dependent protein-ADP-ribosyltransferase YbiA (DUF1768 family)
MIDSFSGEYRFLSNFYPVDVQAYGFAFKSVEAAYQAAKECFSLKRPEVITAFAHDSAFEAKWRGSGDKLHKLKRDADLVVLELPKNWDTPLFNRRPLKVRVMAMLLDRKFAQGTTLLEQLVATGDVPLIEGNTWGDTFWGVCGTTGENMLGKMLMKIRDENRSSK